MTDPIRFAIIGAGWRSEFFLRLAQSVPEKLEVVAVVAHSDSSAQRMAATWQVPVVRTVAQALALQAEFVISAVSWEAMPEVIIELVNAGVAVLAETPPAPTAAELRRLWTAVGSSGLVQVAEQYTLMPGHAARLQVAQSGAIGAVTAVQVHSTHLYHAVSMIRTFLGAEFDPVVVNARTFTAPQADPLRTTGWEPNPVPEPRTTTIATLDFGGGRMGLYDFVENQWWNPLLARRLVVRGTLGEIVDDSVTRLTEQGPISSPISYRRTGIDLNLEGNDVVNASFEGKLVYQNPWVGSRFSEDDIAVASIVQAMGRWVRGDGPEPYSLAQASQDHLLGLAIEESARTGGDVRVGRDIWD